MKKAFLLFATILLSVVFAFADGDQGTGTKSCQSNCIVQQVEEQPIYVKIFKFLGLI